MPHISCVCNEQEFEEALKSYQDIYVVAGLGVILRHIKLKGNRHVRIQVKEIPGVKAEELMPQNIKEEINFLPNGKIPGHLLDEIVDFFKAVMTVKKAENEAMAHVLWNEKDKDSLDKGYRIAIPNQTVSKASVRYEHDHIEKNDIITLDIHSHNTMGAFFSGTDDGDDKKGIFFSGVAGYLNHREPDFKWRLNINETKIDAEVDDIFDVVKKEVKVPEEWLERVSTSSSTSGGYQGGSEYSQNHAGVYSSGKHCPPTWEKNAENGSSSSESSARKSESGSSNSVSGGSRHIGFEDSGYGDYDYEFGGHGGNYHWRNGVKDLYSSNETGTEVITAPPGPTPSYPTTGEVKKVTLPALPAPKVKQIQPGTMSQTQIRQANRRVLTVDEVDSLPLVAGEFDANVINYGKDQAEAHEQITAWLGNLENCDDLLLDVMSRGYAMLTGKGQDDLVRKGFH